MAYVITDACEGVCDMACVRACPVDAIHGALPTRQLEALSRDERAARRLRLFIGPEACICCGACEPECPVDAIHDEGSVPDDERHAVGENAAFFRAKAAR